MDQDSFAKLRSIRSARAMIVSSLDRLESGDKEADLWLRKIFADMSVRMTPAALLCFSRALAVQLEREEALMTQTPKMSWFRTGALFHLFVNDSVYHVLAYQQPFRMECIETGDDVHINSAEEVERGLEILSRRLVGLDDATPTE